MIFFLALGFGILSYLIFIIFRIGLQKRIALVLSKISLEEVQFRAEKKYGERPLFTCDKPAKWEIPIHREKYPDPLAWSASRLKATAGLIGAMLQTKLELNYGERVAVYKENHLDIHILIMGIMRAGGIACPVHGKFASNLIGPYLSNIGATVLITDLPNFFRFYKEGHFGKVTTVLLVNEKSDMDEKSLAIYAEILEKLPMLNIWFFKDAIAGVITEAELIRRGKNDPVYLVHTSGTTGIPKSVILRNGPQSFAIKGWLCYVHLSRRRDKGYMAVPNNHQAVILTFNASLLLGLPCHWSSYHDAESFDATTTIAKLEKGGFTGFFGFPNTYTQLKELNLANYDLSKMRVWASTADASHEVIISRFLHQGSVFKNLGIPIKGAVFLDAQGSSEVGTPSVLRYYTKFTRKYNRRIGRPGSTPLGPSIRIANIKGELVEKEEVGRLEVKGKTVFNAYWNDHDLTIKSFHDKWFFTGDVARIGKDGHIVQLDREVDVIHTKNFPVYSLLIEEILHKHEAVFDICVYGFSQKDGSQLPAAVVALRTGYGYTEEVLLEALNSLLSLDQKLISLEILPWLQFPFGVTGKTLKRTLRERSKERVKQLINA
ncbi:long-chain fatty acid--CoA ligase [Arenibacter sp. N53]|uniref:class I adenylate-forming enzyme family protein n=1 Tax=Arenibacter TaxID=178469 RepID=UPI000CD4795A|nr:MULTISPECIES: class I adenylate-forming enzyme family protein [Arenibacter]MCM4152898.1 long-chain fatty acid--CoA ligase [Arenibacter sp. N53]